MAIHPTACISERAQIGRDVTIGPFVCIEDDVVVGDGCVLGPHACLLQYTRLGNNCRVHAGTALGDLPQDRKFQGEASYVEIGPDCIFREGVTVHRGTQPGSVTRIGRGCLLMANSHVAHNVTLGNEVIMCNGALLAGHVEVGDQAFISANAMVHQFTRVGRLAMLAGGTLAQMDVPPFCITRGLHSNEVQTLNVIGMRRAGVGPADRAMLKQAFRILYRSGLIVPQAVERMRKELDSAMVRELCDFIAASKRGICHYVRSAAGEANGEDDFPRLADAA
jgi:UDP-N-acetylglucosamine acyltransferase